MVRMPPVSAGGGPPGVVTGSDGGAGAGWTVGCRAMETGIGRAGDSRKVRSRELCLARKIQPFIPAKAGIQFCPNEVSVLWLWVPAFAGTNGGRHRPVAIAEKPSAPRSSDRGASFF